MFANQKTRNLTPWFSQEEATCKCCGRGHIGTTPQQGEHIGYQLMFHMTITSRRESGHIHMVYHTKFER
mgnify:CR=1 FL=1